MNPKQTTRQAVGAEVIGIVKGLEEQIDSLRTEINDIQQKEITSEKSVEQVPDELN